MLLLRVSSVASAWAARIYHRFTAAGTAVPPSGPVVLVANHPNSLLDPVLVMAAAGRPVRFLAKAPLFDHWFLGPVLKSAGAIPVYRREDDPSQLGRNEEMFRTVIETLESGSVVGIFPEGTTHSEPALARLKTGAARIALGAARVTGGAFPLVPVGLRFREKDRFRSEATAIVGDVVSWRDIARRNVDDDPDAVVQLTGRIDAALRAVTVNLEQWEDQPLVECAEAVWAAERARDPNPVKHLERLQISSETLAGLRRGSDAGWTDLAADIATHAATLERFQLSPADLLDEVGLGKSMTWALRRFYLLAGYTISIGLAGMILSYLPHRMTAFVVARLKPGYEQLSTYKLFAGIVMHGIWVALLALLVAWWSGLVYGGTVLVALPPLMLAGRKIRERWVGSWHEFRSVLLRRSRAETIAELRSRQKDIATRIGALLARRMRA